MLSGFPPFWGSSDQAVFRRILTKEPDFDYQPWHQISPAAKDFVRRLLDRDACSRISVTQALMHPWILREAADVPLSTEIICRLQSFTHQNRVKCLLMTAAARHLSDEKIGGLRKIFHSIDADAKGEINLHDLTLALQHAGLELEQAGVSSLLAGLDLSHIGVVHVEEFIAAALDQRKVLSAKAVNDAFAALDQDQDGRLAVGDLKAALEECHVSIGTDTLERVMQREGALDSRGMVSAKSFSELLRAGAEADDSPAASSETQASLPVPIVSGMAAAGTLGQLPPSVSRSQLRLSPSKTDSELSSSSEGCSPAAGAALAFAMPGPEPPSPIDLLPRLQPPSPVDSQQNHSSSLSPLASLQPLGGVSPPSPISLLPHVQPPSPIGASSLLQQPAATSPRLLASSRPDGTGGMTLQQILQHYSSSGFGRSRGSSRQGSLDTPRGAGANNCASPSTPLSDVSESWLGAN